MKADRLPDAAIAEARRALLALYDREARDLPWRRDHDPYRVLVSEIMLQQTRVETVLGYYDRWLDRFPTLDALADADEEEVLKAWEGLGYYRRARNLHRAARVVREERAGSFPTEAGALRELPGVGDYTAGAVASIAFGEVVPAVDGNVRRVLARLYDVPAPTVKWLRETAAEWVDEDRPGDWNQAVMELGATICTPRSPECGRCPLARWCRALAAGTVAERPAPPKKRAIPSARIVLAVIHRQGAGVGDRSPRGPGGRDGGADRGRVGGCAAGDGGQVLLERRPADGLLGGLWAFPEERLVLEAGTQQMRGTVGPPGPTVSAPATESHDSGLAAAGRIVAALGYDPAGPPVPLDPVRHAFTHLDARYLPFAIGIAEGPHQGGSETARPPTPSVPDPERYRWVGPADESPPMPVAQRKVLDAWRTLEGSQGAG